MSESDDEKRKREQWEKERQADKERREKAGLTTPELKKFNPHDDIVIDESASTHQKEQPKIDSSVSTAQAQQPKKPSRFDSVRKRFEESGQRLSDNFQRGAKATAEDLKESASKKVRSKLGRQTEDERKDELKKLKDQLAIARTNQQIRAVKDKIRAANQQRNDSVFASNEGDFFGMNMGGLNPEQYFGFGISGNSQPEPSMGGGFSMEVWKEMTNYGGSGSKKSQSQMKDMGMGGDFDFDAYNKLFNSSWMGGGSGKKSTKTVGNGNIMDMFGGGKKGKGLSLDDVKKFYGV